VKEFYQAFLPQCYVSLYKYTLFIRVGIKYAENFKKVSKGLKRK
jgi:hypothetical protein